MNIKYLSSRITFVYKFILPFSALLLSIFFVIGAFNFLSKDLFSFFISLGIFLFICALLFSPLYNLKRVYYNKDLLYFDNYFKKEKIDLQKINKIKMYFIFFYKISYTNNEGKSISIFFLPHISDKFMSFPKTPLSIEKFQKELFLYN